MVKYLKGKDTPISDLEEGANVESDCEDNSPGTEKEAQKSKGERNETRAVLITGSFAACAIFGLLLLK